MKNILFKEAKRLYGLGFAIIWLHPKSKRPVEMGWTTGDRSKWDYLKETYFEGLNLGVRLGPASPIKNAFLAVIDVDVKSTDKRHRTEALLALRKFLGDTGVTAEQLESIPEVRSGRGLGSRHLYCITPRTFTTFNPARSDEEIKYHGPSKIISKRERKELTEKELQDGVRLGPAWEISLYSEGRQVVLPPSIHPDSGEPYRWKTFLENIDQLPLITFQIPSEETLGNKKVKTRTNDDAPADKKFHFEITPVDLHLADITDELRDGIINGTGITDRSGFMLRVASIMQSQDYSINEILTVLTDPKTYLGRCAYDHTMTKNRMRAGRWAYKYTVKKILAEKDAKAMFEADLPDEGQSLDGEALAKQNAEIAVDLPSAAKTGYYYMIKDKPVPAYGELLTHFAELYPFKTIADMKAVFVFNGTHYENFTPIDVKAFSEKNFNPKPSEKIRAEFYHKVLANNVDRRSFFLDSTEGKVNFNNGVLDLNDTTKELLPHDPMHGFRGVLPYDYDADADCPVFKQWLFDIMLEDKKLCRILQEYMGYVLRGGDYKYHKALWLGGTGRNGKSTFIDVLKSLIGAGNFSTISIKTLVSDKFAGADLDGKIANFSEETSPHELRDSGPFKNLTGDGDIFAQKKYGDPYSFRNRAKLIMTYNTIPDLSDLSAGMLSRPIIIPFEKTIAESEQDRSIKEKLLAELPGIFNFAMRGWERLEAQNEFTTSDRSKKALQRVKEESCSVVQWVKNNIDFDEDANSNDPTSRWRPADVFKKYKAWEKYAYKSSEFFRRFNSIDEVQNHKKRKNDGIFYFGLNIHE